MPMGKLGVRHVQAVLLSSALMVNHMQLGNLGMAVVVITQEQNERQWRKIFFSRKAEPMGHIVSIITGSFFYSQMIFSIIGGYLSSKINNKMLILTSSAIAFMVTYLTPMLVNAIDWKAFFFVRLVQGAAQGFVKPVVYNLAARWLPTEEMLLLGPAILCGTYSGVCFMLLMGGYLGAGQGGWPSIFYFSGNCGLLWSIAFYGLGFSSPDACYYISDQERDHINSNVPPSVLQSTRVNIPWRKIFTNIPLWSLLICQFANNWAFHVFVKILPIFLQHKLHYDLHETGVICGLPFFFVCITIYSITLLFNYLWSNGKLNHVVVRHLCNAIAQFGAAYCFMVCSASENVTLTVVFHHLGLILSALQIFGFYMNFYDLSPTYVGLISGLVSGISNLGAIVGPHITLTMYNQYEDDDEAWAKDRQFIGWRKAYDLITLNYFIAGTAFMFFGEVKTQDFDKNEQRRPTRKVKLAWT